MEFILMAHPKKLLFGENDHLGPRISHPVSPLWIRSKDCFTILHNESGLERHGNSINGFSEGNLIQRNLVFLKQKSYGVLLTLNLLTGIFISFT